MPYNGRTFPLQNLYGMDEQEFKELVIENPYTGTSKQVVNLCTGIYEASVALDAQTFRAYRNGTDITDKIFSKLRVIGKTLCSVPAPQRKELVKALPDSYSTIHVLSSLKAPELLTAVKTKRISRKTTIRGARDYVKHIRFPALTGDPQIDPNNITAPPTADETWRQILSIHEDPSQPLTPDDLLKLRQEMTKVIKGYGVEVRTTEDTSIRKLQQTQRSKAETFWKSVLEDQLPQEWFDELPVETRKQFNLSGVQEVYKTPLRQFTGLLMRTCGGRKNFWEKHGRTYIAKMHLEMAETSDRIRRNNHKRRLEEVFADKDGTRGGIELFRWNNKMLKGAGLPIQ